ncbi:hypothetical protein [Bradyrhizobium guangxiense]|uniref:hypothetical protein n=1 Tax=Bradyrhizobium guangxiense TaxID=1325115 RepID=UPI001009087B|nr:hypothetical protein [Bradyrhizobium guangxiense]
MRDELAELIDRAEDAIATADRLVDENVSWRRSTRRQLDQTIELGTEFRKLAVSRLPAISSRHPAEDN